ncbi:MAG TPA: sigma-70 family RNA polymerase sigma factor [Pirellulales bacterium]
MPSDFDLAALIQQHQAGVWRYLRVLGCDSAAADDLTQEVFLAALERPFEQYSVSATAAYLRTVAKHLFLAALRKDARWVSQETLTLEQCEQADAEWAKYAGRDSGTAYLDALERCFAALDAQSQQALNLRFRDDAARGEIARSLGLSEDGAKNVIQRAKGKLKLCIERRLAAEDPAPRM